MFTEKKCWSAPMLGATIGLLVLSAPAAAGPGDHIRAGNAEIIPSVTWLAGWRSNVFLAAGDACATDGTVLEPTHSGAAFDLIPAIGITSGPSDNLTYKLDANFTARKYLTSDLSNMDRYQDFMIVGSMQVRPNSPVGFEARNELRNFGRETDFDTADNPYFGRFEERLTLFSNIRPGGAISFDAGGRLGYIAYNRPHRDETTETLVNSRSSVAGLVDFRWKFFPKTALVADLEFEKFNWKFNEGNTSASEVSASPKPDGWLMRASTGVRGRVTEKLQIRATLGYGFAGYEGDAVDMSGFPDSLLVGSELVFDPIEGQSVSVGYTKDFQDSVSSSFSNYNLFFGRYQGRFFDKLTADLSATYRRDQYEGALVATDATIRPKVEVGYELTPFLVAEVGVGWVRRLNVESATAAGGQDCSREFDDVEVNGGLVFTY
jgi:hypothetical protein